MYMDLYKLNKHTHLGKHVRTHTHTNTQSGCNPEPLSTASVQCGALQPRGEAPASSPARAGQAEHLAPQKGHIRPHPSTPTVLLGVKEASPTPLFPLCQALPSVKPSTRLDSPHSLSHSRCISNIRKWLLPAASYLISREVFKGPCVPVDFQAARPVDEHINNFIRNPSLIFHKQFHLESTW